MPCRPEVQLQIDPTTIRYRTRALQLAVLEARRYQKVRGITPERIAALRQQWERYTPNSSPICSPSATKPTPPPFSLGPTATSTTPPAIPSSSALEVRPVQLRPFFLASATEAEAVLHDVVLLLSNTTYSLEKNYSHTVEELGKLRLWMNPHFLPGIVRAPRSHHDICSG